MAWTTISNLLVAVGAKPFATTIQALRDNPIAIADGDANAPKVQGIALSNVFVNARDISNNNFHNYTGLTARAKLVRLDIFCQSLLTTQALKISFSANNGSSYGSEQNFAVPSGSAATNTWFILYVDLQTGDWNLVSGTQYVTTGSGTFTVPSDCNALRVRQDPSTTDSNSSLMILSGRA